MSFKNMMTKEDGIGRKIRWLKKAIETAEAVLIGAGAGLSSSAGMTYSGDRFKWLFPDGWNEPQDDKVMKVYSGTGWYYAGKCCF